MTARHTSDRAATLVRTRTGIVIGGAYVQPPPSPGAEAERIQAALLKREPEESTGSKLRTGALFVGFLFFTLFGWHALAVYLGG